MFLDESKKNKISIVVPVYNSAKTLKELSDRVDKIFKERLNKYDYELILINDYSTDCSLKICKELSEIKSTIKVISFSRNFGQHNALMAGFNYAKGNYIISMDDDLQTPPEEIPKLVEKIEGSNFDVIFAKYNKKQHNIIRNAMSNYNDKIAYYLLKKPKNIKISSFFIARNFIIQELIKYKNPYPYIGGLIFRATQNIGNVLIKHKERKYNKSNYNLKKLLQLWLNGLTNFSVMPLRLVSFCGIFFSLLSLIMLIILFIRKVCDPSVQLGWTSLISAIFLFGGIILFSIGLVGEYIGRLYLSMNNEPQFIIKDKINI